MAVLWQQQVDDRTYEVRKAGNSVRLYTNQVFHSQWNPNRPLMKTVWDCLTLPGFFLPESRPARVLMMGVGGGAGIRQLQQFFNPDAIVGIELDPVHLGVARDWFGVTAENVELVQSDAIRWLTQYRGPAFDMVIDDLFGDDDGEATRVVAVNRAWADQLCRVCSDDGVIVVNFESREQLQDSELAKRNSAICRRYIFEQESYGNAVGVFLRSARSRRHWERRIESSEQLDARQRRVALSTWVSLCSGR